MKNVDKLTETVIKVVAHIESRTNAVVNMEEHIIAFDIDYCPFCGRRLE